MPPDLLTVTGLEVGFATDAGLARVLDRVNLGVGRGEIVGLVGESGCGKTTLARAILGVLPANSARIGAGRIDFDGRNLLDADPDDLARNVRGRQIAFVPQDPFSSFNPVFTIGAQIDELMKWKSPARAGGEGGDGSGGGGGGGGRSGGKGGGGGGSRFYTRARRRADRRRVMELLRQVQLPDPDGILKKYPHEVSGGQRQRLMIAMALLPEPKLIIADEPTTALDVTIQAQILKLLRQLATAREVSVLFTTHDLGTAWEICDRVTVMYAGQEVESAPADAFFRTPRHPYTMRLLASLPSRERGIAGIPGQIPSLIDPPAGCRFHPRCDFAVDLCRAARPEAERFGDDGGGGIEIDADAHWVRCFQLAETAKARSAP